MSRLVQVDDFVYISDCYAAADAAQVARAGVRRIVRLFPGESPGPPVPGVRYLVLATVDLPEYDIRQDLETAVRWVLDGVKRDEKTLVHCHAGISRSATVVLMYLMLRYRCSLEQAFFRLRRVRPQIRPNPGFIAHLKASEARLPWVRKKGAAVLCPRFWRDEGLASSGCPATRRTVFRVRPRASRMLRGGSS